MRQFVDVLLPLPLQSYYTYALPAEWVGRVEVGCRVVVSFGQKRFYTAIVVAVHERAPEGCTVKEVSELLDASPVVLPLQRRLWQWIADYYLCTEGEVYKAALPAGMKGAAFRAKTEAAVRLTEPYRTAEALQAALSALARAPQQAALVETYLRLNHGSSDGAAQHVPQRTLLEAVGCSAATLRTLEEKGIMERYDAVVGRMKGTAMGEAVALNTLNSLNEAQQAALTEVTAQLAEKEVCLLHGVTSSGKTEIYVHLIAEALAAGRQVLYLLPEIALTTQITRRLQRVFGDRLGVYHSKFSDGERVEVWHKQLSEAPYEVVLGVRSSIFLPFQRLGLVIVDEEHESSFKQQDPAPRYHGRNAAIMLARLSGAKTLLGTATPSVESYFNAQRGKYGLVTLTERYQRLQLPDVTVVDEKDLRKRKLMKGPLSPQLTEAMGEALRAGEQVILFQNRRGFAPMVMCRACGWVPKCRFCDVSLTYHRAVNLLTCHYCGAAYHFPQRCHACEGEDLTTRGYGTEKIEDVVAQLFPTARVARMDLDTTRSRDAYDQIIRSFERGETEILIGTQMVSKGLDFDRVSVVGILDADAMMQVPDFRAHERAFQLMAQVAGRAGRKHRQGRVFLQTKSAELPLVRQTITNDYAGLYADQLAERQLFLYPPLRRMVYVYLKGRREETVEVAAATMASRLKEQMGDRILGPDKPAVGRVQQLYIRKIVVKAEPEISMRGVYDLLQTERTALLAEERFRSLQVYFDVDPQ